MRTFMHARHRHDAYFHSHPMHAAYSLIASLALAGLMVQLMMRENIACLLAGWV